MALRKIVYRLEFSAPGSTLDFICQLEAEVPFGAFAEGDLVKLDLAGWPEASGVTARVAKVMHLLTNSADQATLVHHTNVFLAEDDWWEKGFGV
jgi:hypothetical protein